MLDLRAILKQVGMTAIYVTHDQTEAFAVADRLAIMNAGRIEQVAAPEAAYRRPATPFVARFLGFHNVWPGRAAGDGLIETPVGLFRIDGFKPPPGATVELLARPQAFSIQRVNTAGVTPAINQVSGVVHTASFRGRFSQVWLDVNGESVLLEVQDSGDYRPGDRVLVTFAADSLQPFP
jgi:ABC-type Fe3+/spermidine/putrescine transport system ATPase subunit